MIVFGLQLFPEAASSVAGKIDALFWFITAISVFFTVFLGVLTLYFAVKYKRRSDDEKPARIEGSHKLEMIWIIVPSIIVAIMFVWSTIIYFHATRPPEDALQIYGIGKQWMWKFQHPNGHREINDLHVPLGQAVRVTLTSEDVIHDFYVPAFRVKVDVVPGRYSSIWFKPTKIGTYHLFCAEYCGTEHSLMIGKVTVMEPEAYEKWVAEGMDETASMVSKGERLFNQFRCGSCHGENSTAIGPSLHGLFGKEVQLHGGQTVTADARYIRESIIVPNQKITAGYSPVMPTYTGQITEEDMLQLIEYIKTLGRSE